MSEDQLLDFVARRARLERLGHVLPFALVSAFAIALGIGALIQYWGKDPPAHATAIEVRLGTWMRGRGPSIIGPEHIHVHPAGPCKAVSFPLGADSALEAMRDDPVRILIDPNTCDGWAAESLGERSIRPLTIEEVRSRRGHEAAAGSIVGLIFLAMGLYLGGVAVVAYRSSREPPSGD